MERSMVILVQPQKWDEDEETWVGVTDDEAQMDLRWDEFIRLKAILVHLGFDFGGEHQERNMQFNCSGCGWHADMLGTVCEISSQNIALLENRAAELIAIRDGALAKLTLEEQCALGLLKLP